MINQLVKIGSYTPKTVDAKESIDREFYRQGWIMKDEEAFLHHPERVCYIPELSDSVYTRQDFLSLCNKQKEFAHECFYSIDWQHPETWIDEQFIEKEWGWCPRCKKIYEMAGKECSCPSCFIGRPIT